MSTFPVLIHFLRPLAAFIFSSGVEPGIQQLLQYTKIGETRFQKFADLSEIDILITDSGAKQDDIASLRSIVGQLIICD